MYIKPYNCYIKKTNISYLETTNDLAEKPTNKSTNKEILYYLIIQNLKNFVDKNGYGKVIL